MTATESASLVGPLAEVLEQILRGQLERHQALLECLERKRQAIRAADLEAIEALCRKEQVLVERLAQLEEQRRPIIAKLSGVCRPGGSLLTLRELCAHVPSGRGESLEAIGQQLATTAEAVGRASSIVPQAADALGRHLGRLVHAVRTSVDRARLYSRQGRLSESALPITVDVKS